MGEKDGSKADTASTVEPDICTCRTSASLSMISTVSGSALAGSWVRAAVTMIVLCSSASEEASSEGAMSCANAMVESGASARAPTK